MEKALRIIGDKIELSLVSSIYKTKVETVNIDGEKQKVETQVLAKELFIKKWLSKDAITSVEEYINNNNTISKTRCIIYDKYAGKFFAVNHKVETVMDSLNRTSNKIGF